MENFNEFNNKATALIEKFNALFEEYKIPAPNKNITFFFIEGKLKMAFSDEVTQFLLRTNKELI
jgi:hypothetical protein